MMPSALVIAVGSLPFPKSKLLDIIVVQLNDQFAVGFSVVKVDVGFGGSL